MGTDFTKKVCPVTMLVISEVSSFRGKENENGCHAGRWLCWVREIMTNFSQDLTFTRFHGTATQKSVLL
jgi:hypothetical protein